LICLCLFVCLFVFLFYVHVCFFFLPSKITITIKRKTKINKIIFASSLGCVEIKFGGEIAWVGVVVVDLCVCFYSCLFVIYCYLLMFVCYLLMFVCLFFIHVCLFVCLLFIHVCLVVLCLFKFLFVLNLLVCFVFLDIQYQCLFFLFIHVRLFFIHSCLFVLYSFMFVCFLFIHVCFLFHSCLFFIHSCLFFLRSWRRPECCNASFIRSISKHRTSHH